MSCKIRIDGRNFDLKALKTVTAKDAFRLPLDIDALEVHLQAMGVDTLRLNTRAAKRSDDLQNPDLGRRLAQKSVDTIRTQLPIRPPTSLWWSPMVFLPLPSNGMPSLFYRSGIQLSA